MQGRGANILNLYEKLEAFVQKKWTERVESGNLAMFPSAEEYSDRTGHNLWPFEQACATIPELQL